MNRSVSIIMPIKDRVDELNFFINSFQELKSYIDEVIIIDDFSSEDISTQIKKICVENNFLYKKNIKNLGPALSKNIGVDHASSKYIWFVDSDVIFLDNNVVKNAINFLIQHPRSIVGCEMVNDKLNKPCYRLSKILPSCYSYFNHYRRDKKIIKKTSFVPSCNLFIERETFLYVGGFPDLVTGEDKLFCLIGKRKNIYTYFNTDVAILHLYSQSGRVEKLDQIKNIINCNGLIFGYSKSKNLFYYYTLLLLSLPIFIISQINISLNYSHDNKVKNSFIFLKTLKLIFFDKEIKKFLNKGNKLKNDL